MSPLKAERPLWPAVEEEVTETGDTKRIQGVAASFKMERDTGKDWEHFQ